MGVYAMRKFFLYVLMILCSAGLKSQEKMKTAAVLDFQNKGDVTQDESSILSNRFRGLLVESKAFKVLERDKMAEILKEQDLFFPITAGHRNARFRWDSFSALNT